MDRLGGNFESFDGEGGPDDFVEDYGSDHGAHSNPPPSPVGQDERRMQVRAYNHWSSLLGGQSLPHIEDLEPEFLGDFGPYSVLLDFSTGSTTPTVQFIGTELRGECRMHDLVESLGDIPRDSLLARIADNYLKVTAEQGPVPFEDECINARGESVAYRGILLPYSSDHDTIDFVYAVINWKEVADSRTADELLAEIDRAMEDTAFAAPQVEPDAKSVAEIVRFHREETAAPQAEPESADPWASDDNILEMRGADHAVAEGFADLPTPSFGHAESEDEGEAEAPLYGEEGYVGSEEHEEGGYEPLYGEEGYVGVEEEDEGGYEPLYGEEGYAGADYASEPAAEAVQEYSPLPSRRDRMVDALGNPIGGAAEDAPPEEGSTSGITTAADYGLPEWDDEEDEGEDVDELVNPLANIDLNSRLLSLVNAGSRGKKTVDLATLTDTPADEDDEPQVERQLFRPKAPSVDTLLSPEPYDPEAEEAEAHEEYAYDEPVEAQPVADDYAADPYALTEMEDTPVEAIAEHAETGETDETGAWQDDYVAEASAGAIGYAADAEIDDCVAAVGELPVIDFGAETPAVQPVEDEFASVEEAPLELGEDLILSEAPVDGAVYGEGEPATAFEGDSFSDAVEAEAEAEPEPEPEVLELCEEEPAHDLPAPAQPVPEDSLVGLQAAVRDLAEAARNTEDLSRRALYEAVGRAFDVSIKAVIAAEAHAGRSPNVIEHLPIDMLPQEGPEMALVLVRRTADGGTEIVGEVPHDSTLMETATLKLAAR